jgi:predicted metal-dependent phosphoesterase TrpH
MTSADHEPLDPPPGWVRVDCHTHTRYSGDAVTVAEEVPRAGRAGGLDVVFVTDHHAVDGAFAAHGAQRDGDARIYIGEEIKTTKGEIIGLFLTERIPYVLPLEECAQRIRDQGGLVYAPHPFDKIRNSLGIAGLERLADAGLLDIVEGFNAKIENDALNVAAREFAVAGGFPLAAGSDAHDPFCLGSAAVLMPDFDGPARFLENLADSWLEGAFTPHSLRFPPHPNALPDPAVARSRAIVHRSGAAARSS